MVTKTVRGKTEKQGSRQIKEKKEHIGWSKFGNHFWGVGCK